MIWNIVAFVAFAVIVVLMVRVVRRESDKDLNTLKKQANCPHPYTYMFAGKRLCATCGKEQPRRRHEEMSNG